MEDELSWKYNWKSIFQDLVSILNGMRLYRTWSLHATSFIFFYHTHTLTLLRDKINRISLYIPYTTRRFIKTERIIKTMSMSCLLDNYTQFCRGALLFTPTHRQLNQKKNIQCIKTEVILKDIFCVLFYITIKIYEWMTLEHTYRPASVLSIII